MAGKKVSAEEFIRAWQTSKDLNEFCEKTGMAKKAATSRAGQYRRRYQINLKKYPPTKINWDKLRKLAEELA